MPSSPSSATVAASPGPHGEHEHFWNLPNTITVVRTAVIPVLVGFPLYAGPTGSRVVAWAFIIAAVGDLVDGWLARRGQQVTEIGKLLDPLADKLLVSSALIVLVAMARIPAGFVWMVVVIVGRELAVTGLRGLASAGGEVIGARRTGKAKTTLQNIAIAALLFPDPTLGLPAHRIGFFFLTLATALTLYSGWLYWRDYFRHRNSRAAS